MSRWRRQQRRRAGRLRFARATETRLDQEFASMRAAILKSQEQAFTGYLTVPVKVDDVAKAVRDAINQIVPLPESKTTIKATARNSNRTVDIDITVSDPSPEMAALLLEMGGHWVGPRIVQELDFGFTFEGKPRE